MYTSRIQLTRIRATLSVLPESIVLLLYEQLSLQNNLHSKVKVITHMASLHFHEYYFFFAWFRGPNCRTLVPFLFLFIYSNYLIYINILCCVHLGTTKLLHKNSQSMHKNCHTCHRSQLISQRVMAKNRNRECQ